MGQAECGAVDCCRGPVLLLRREEGGVRRWQSIVVWDVS